MLLKLDSDFRIFESAANARASAIPCSVGAKLHGKFSLLRLSASSSTCKGNPNGPALKIVGGMNLRIGILSPIVQELVNLHSVWFFSCNFQQLSTFRANYSFCRSMRRKLRYFGNRRKIRWGSLKKRDGSILAANVPSERWPRIPGRGKVARSLGQANEIVFRHREDSVAGHQPMRIVVKMLGGKFKQLGVFDRFHLMHQSDRDIHAFPRR